MPEGRSPGRPVVATPGPVGHAPAAPAPANADTGTPVPGTPLSGTPSHGTPLSGTPLPGTPLPGTPILPAEAPLLPGLLGMVGDGATAHELAERLRVEVGDGSPKHVGRMLHQLVRLGLVRPTGSDGRGRRYVVTSLGRQTLAVSFGEGSEFATRLADLERLRTDLLNTIAHDLRTPLTAIRTCAGLLLDPAAEPAPEQRRQLAESIARNADHMAGLVEDVLDLARFRSARIQLQLRRFDARVVVRELATSMAAVVAEHGQQIDITAPDIPIWVHADHRRVVQAVLNLLSNAQKFSPDGATIRLSVTITGRAGSTEILWRVSDDGPGISAEDQVRLFERFFVGRSDRGTPLQGTGLGLPIALAIAQAHGGRIEVDSAPGRGSTFTFVVPAVGPPEGDEL